MTRIYFSKFNTQKASSKKRQKECSLFTKKILCHSPRIKETKQKN